MAEQLDFIALIEQLKQLPVPVDTNGNIDFFDPPNIALAQYQQLNRIATLGLPVIAVAFNSGNHCFLHLLMSLLPIETLLQLMELALAYGNMSLKTHDYFFGHERFYSYCLCWSQVCVIDRPDIGMLYSTYYEAKPLIAYKAKF